MCLPVQLHRQGILVTFQVAKALLDCIARNRWEKTNPGRLLRGSRLEDISRPTLNFFRL